MIRSYLEDFKTINVQNSNVEFLVVFLHCFVYCLRTEEKWTVTKWWGNILTFNKHSFIFPALKVNYSGGVVLCKIYQYIKSHIMVQHLLELKCFSSTGILVRFVSCDRSKCLFEAGDLHQQGSQKVGRRVLLIKRHVWSRPALYWEWQKCSQSFLPIYYPWSDLSVSSSSHPELFPEDMMGKQELHRSDGIRKRKSKMCRLHTRYNIQVMRQFY